MNQLLTQMDTCSPRLSNLFHQGYLVMRTHSRWRPKTPNDRYLNCCFWKHSVYRQNVKRKHCLCSVTNENKLSFTWTHFSCSSDIPKTYIIFFISCWQLLLLLIFFLLLCETSLNVAHNIQFMCQMVWKWHTRCDITGTNGP